ncbi:MAG TPA: ABC transporter ATP-binding protein [Propionibacteriaceae bacterium]|nr:ABC transporter ATP-binding protein [Propionibacteriaceae bacterium]
MSSKTTADLTSGKSPPPRDELPPALSSMWRLCKLGYTHEPRLVVVVVILTVLQAVPDALFALWLKLMADAVVAGDAAVLFATLAALAASATLTWLLRVITTRMTRRFRDRVTIALETHVATLQASIQGLQLQERRDYLDRLAVLRNQVFVLDHMYMSLLETMGWIVRVVVTIVLLTSIDPLLVLLAVFAVPTVVSSAWRPGVERQVEEQFAQHNRLAEHMFATATSATAAKEVRVAGIGDDLAERRRLEWQRWFRPVARARWGTAISHSMAWAIFGLGYIGAVVFVVVGLDATVGSVLLILAAGARLAGYVGGTIGEIGFLRGIWLDGSRRLVWLENYAAALSADTDVAVPERLVDGIRLEHVSFAYPGTDRLALKDLSLHLPAGAVVAVVGENGAGKSTLVKLLAKMYEPTSGEILIDGRPLRRMPATEWRDRLAGAFQDFFRFEFSAQHSVGLGDLPRLDNEAAVTDAVRKAGADDVVDRLPEGLHSQLGSTWPGGQELSFGQWQKLALSRGYMRAAPLLMVLDEPTAALDAETEHELFERYADAARVDESRGSDVGSITILVSHRFSTVRMADLIVVLDGARLAEVGSHDELMKRDGPYADLYRIQAAAYH